ncbi:enolase C-terminal domain-like protein [Kribbella sp. NPDC050459]|uniref:enolase C-terminal domain-like protein n=1 Tax=Kribbella sp. NPDC050459 TaxID=3155785 RepID=UPI0033DD7088
MPRAFPSRPRTDRRTARCADHCATSGRCRATVSTVCGTCGRIAALAAVPNLRHLEWFHDHVRIEQMLFDGTVDPHGGTVTPSSEPGNGLTWRATAAAPYRVM